jgi:hypothetical protein
MKKWIINPRILDRVTKNMNMGFGEMAMMEKLNNGSFIYSNLVCGTIVAVAFICLPMAFDNLALLVMSSIVGAVLLGAVIANIPNYKRLHSEWEMVKQSVGHFYTEFNISMMKASSLPYPKILEKIRGELSILSAEVLATSAQEQMKARENMRKKYDLAKQYLPAGFDNCRGYKIFFESAMQTFDPCI